MRTKEEKIARIEQLTREISEIKTKRRKARNLFFVGVAGLMLSAGIVIVGFMMF